MSRILTKRAIESEKLVQVLLRSSEDAGLVPAFNQRARDTFVELVLSRLGMALPEKQEALPFLTAPGPSTGMVAKPPADQNPDAGSEVAS